MVQPQAQAPAPVVGAPRLTSASAALLRQIEIVDDHGDRRAIFIPAEHALRVSVDGRQLVTLMTLGARPELLVLGYLCNQGLIDDITEVASIAVDAELTVAIVTSRTGAQGVASRIASRIVSTDHGEGAVFGDLLSRLSAIKIPPAASARISQSTLYRVLETMRQHGGAIHHAAGSVHTCALFHGADLLVSVEDVGRHNALDTIAGWMVLHGVAGADKSLFTTGRLTSEMVMKCAQSGIPIIVSRNGTSALGYEIAARLGMSLFGRAANRRFLCYVGAERFDAEPASGTSSLLDTD